MASPFAFLVCLQRASARQMRAFVVKGFAFPITCDSGDSGDPAPPPMPQLGKQSGCSTPSQTVPVRLALIRVIGGVVLFFRSPDHQMVPITRFPAALCRCPSARDPPGSFPFLLQRKHFLNSTLGWPLGDPCVTLGWRLGDPCVTQSQSQSQVSAEGCSSSFGQMQLPTAICFIFKDLCPSRPEALANSRRFLRANQVRKRTMALRVTIAK
jgi:hypothetical protein